MFLLLTILFQLNSDFLSSDEHKQGCLVRVMQGDRITSETTQSEHGGQVKNIDSLTWVVWVTVIFTLCSFWSVIIGRPILVL